jgi:hypothetical protein
MATFYVATSRVNRNPVRVQEWNASIRGGDDFKLALTLYGDDDGTPAIVTGSNSLLVLRRERNHPHSWDYGLGWATGGSAIPGVGGPCVQSVGFVTTVRPGGINFSLSQAQTAQLSGRYHLILMVDLPDGSFTQFEGVIQVRGGVWNRAPMLLHTSGVFFTLDISQLDNAILAALVENGIPVDQDGFPLLIIDGANSGLTVDALTQLILSLPTTLPDGAGVLWLDGGVLALS